MHPHSSRITFILAIIATTAAVAAAEQGTVVLSETSVWRSHITWMRAMSEQGGSMKPTRVWNGIKEDSDPPPADWIRPAFDDSSWTLWRETHHVHPLKLKKGKRQFALDPEGKDTGLMLYEPGQYGIRRSVFTGLHCLRGRFLVNDTPGDATLTVEFRGGLVVYLNGEEIGRSHLPAKGDITPDTIADAYPNDAFVDMRTEIRNAKKKYVAPAEIPLAPDTIRKLNARIRKFETSIPAAKLKKGVNVLALRIHRSPCAPPDTKLRTQWSSCGPVTIRLTSTGGIEPATGAPKGFHVWNPGANTRISPFGFAYRARTYQGAMVLFERFPLTWGDPLVPTRSIRMVAARGGSASGQVGVYCDSAIKGLKATIGKLSQEGGDERIPASATRIGYTTFPEKPIAGLQSASVSFLDALQEHPPAEVPVRKAGEIGSWVKVGRRGGVTTAVAPGAAAAVWTVVDIPADASAGSYRGTLTVSADGHGPVTVPIRLDVADWTVPDPRDWPTHVGNPHSPDTLAEWYNVPLWSEKHWEMVETTLAYMGKIGGGDVYLPLRAKTQWFRNEQSYVYWVKKPDGTFTHDYRVLDRYLDLVGKYLKPEVYCLYVSDLAGRTDPNAAFSVFDPKTGSVRTEKGPAYASTEEATAFWKPVLDGVIDRLKKRGAAPEQIFLGLAWEGAGATTDTGKTAANLFKPLVPKETRMVQLAHYGGARHGEAGIPYGYAMSVWGNKTKVKAEGFGAPNLPIKVVQHYRADGVFDMRPTAHRGALRLAVEHAMGQTQGVGPFGMDFWVLPANAEKKRRGDRTMEGAGASNLSMSGQSTSALLAPGPDGPISTARFETLREGLQLCAARAVIERALADAGTRDKLGDPLAKRCEDFLKKRRAMFKHVICGGWAHAEGWRWYEGSGWQDRAFDLFTCAGDVERALK